MLAFWKELPILAWAFPLCALLAAGHYLRLILRSRRMAPESAAAWKRLIDLGTALDQFARHHQNRLPESLDTLVPDLADAFVYRAVPRRDLDERLIVLHDRLPQHALLEFPSVRPAFGLRFAGGKTLLVNEDQLDKLLQADDVLRDQCGLAPAVQSEARREVHGNNHE